MGQRGQLELGWGYLERGDTGSRKQRPCIRFVLCVSRFLFCVLINPLGMTQWSLAREGMVGWPRVGGLATVLVPLLSCTRVHRNRHRCLHAHTRTQTHMYTWTHRQAHMDTDRHENVPYSYTDTVISA